MFKDAKVISLETYMPARRPAAAQEIRVLFIGDVPGQRGAVIEIARPDRPVRVQIDHAGTPDDLESRLTDGSYHLYVVEQWVDLANATPLVDLCLQDEAARTIVLSDLPEVDRPHVEARFPGALTLSRYDLDADVMVSLALGQTTIERPDLAGTPGIEGILAAAHAVRASVTSIRREMAAADSEIDGGDTLSGQSHLVTALRRLADVETALSRMENTLATQLRLNQAEEKA